MSIRMQAISTWPLSQGTAAIAAALLLAAAEAAEAQVPGARLDGGADRGALYYAQCLQDWDAATHMTKQEWSSSCRRLARDRHDLPLKPHRADGLP
jgi:hypothetical protein